MTTAEWLGESQNHSVSLFALMKAAPVLKGKKNTWLSVRGGFYDPPHVCNVTAHVTAH